MHYPTGRGNYSQTRSVLVGRFTYGHRHEVAVYKLLGYVPLISIGDAQSFRKALNLQLIKAELESTCADSRNEAGCK